MRPESANMSWTGAGCGTERRTEYSSRYPGPSTTALHCLGKKTFHLISERLPARDFTLPTPIDQSGDHVDEPFAETVPTSAELLAMGFSVSPERKPSRLEYRFRELCGINLMTWWRVDASLNIRISFEMRIREGLEPLGCSITLFQSHLR